MRRRLSVLAVLPLLLAGCGGSSHHSGPGSSSDTLGPQIALAWAARTRAFSGPSAATAALVTFPSGAPSGYDASQIVTRPSGAAAVTQTVQLGFAVHPGRHLVRVDFLADANSSGTPLSTATLNVQVADDGSLRTLDGKPLGTIANVSNVTGIALQADQTIEVGQTTDLLTAATTANGVVALVPGSVSFALATGTGLLKANADGSITGLATGTATLTASVDGVTGAPVAVTVLPAPLVARTVSVVNSDIAYDATRNRIWIAVPQSASGGNTIRSLDATTGALGTPISIGANPSLLAISDDDSRLYVGLSGTPLVQPVDLTTGALGTGFVPQTTNNGPGYAIDIAVQPGSPDTVAVIATDVVYGGAHGPAIFDAGVARPNQGSFSIGSRLLWASPSELYAYDPSTYGSAYTFAVDAEGATQSAFRGAITPSALGLTSVGNVAYNRGGQIFDLATLTQTGAFSLPSGTGSAVQTYGPAVDLGAKRAYFLQLGVSDARLVAFDTDTLLETGSRRISNVTFPSDFSGYETPRLVRVGTKGLAFRLSDQVVFVDDLSGL